MTYQSVLFKCKWYQTVRLQDHVLKILEERKIQINFLKAYFPCCCYSVLHCHDYFLNRTWQQGEKTIDQIPCIISLCLKHNTLYFKKKYIKVYQKEEILSSNKVSFSFPPTGKIHPVSKMAIIFDPMVQF